MIQNIFSSPPLGLLYFIVVFFVTDLCSQNELVDIEIRTQSDVDNLFIEDTLKANLILRDITSDIDFSKFSKLVHLHGALTIQYCTGLTSISFFQSLQNIEGRISLRTNSNVEKISFPSLSFVQGLHLFQADNVLTIDFPNLKKVGTTVHLSTISTKSHLRDLFPELVEIGNQLEISGSNMTISGFAKLSKVPYISLSFNDSLIFSGLDTPIDSLRFSSSQNKYLSIDALNGGLTRVNKVECLNNEFIALFNVFKNSSIPGSLEFRSNKFGGALQLNTSRLGNLSFNKNQLPDSVIIKADTLTGLGFSFNTGLCFVKCSSSKHCGSISIQNDSGVNGLDLGCSFKGLPNLMFSNNKALESIVLRKETDGEIDFLLLSQNNLFKEYNDKSNLSRFVKIEISNNPHMVSFSGSNSVKAVDKDVLFSHNALLETIVGFDSIETIGGDLRITSNANLRKIGNFDFLNSTKSVRIQQSSLSEVVGFNKLDSLERIITISFNAKLRKIEGFSSVRSMLDLTVTGNGKLNSIKVLKNLRNLRSMEIYDNGNLQHVEGFETLESVDLISMRQNGTLMNLPDFSSLLHGKRIDISGVSTDTLAAFKSAITIDDLSLSGDGLRYVAGFSELTSGSISLSGKNLESIQGFEKLHSADKLYLNGSAIQKIPEFASLQRLGSLTLNGLGFTELNAFNEIDSLELISITKSKSLVKIHGFDQLEYIARTMRLEFNSRLEIISGFDKLKELRSLSVKNNSALRAIEGFSDLVKIHYKLYITNNQNLSECCFLRNAFANLEGPETFVLKDNGSTCNSGDGVFIRCSPKRSMSIEEISSTDNDGLAIYGDSTIITSGTVQSHILEIGEDKILFLADSTLSGVAINLSEYHPRMLFQVGDVIELEAQVKQKNGQITLIPKGIIRIADGRLPYAPILIDNISDQHESSFVEIENVNFFTVEIDTSRYSTIKATNGIDTFGVSTLRLSDLKASDFSNGTFSISGFAMQNDEFKPWDNNYNIVPLSNDGVVGESLTSASDNHDASDLFKISPNPFDNYIVVNHEKIQGTCRIDISDSRGLAVLSLRSINGSRLDMSQFSPGFYFVRILSEGSTYVFKLLKV